MEIPIAMIHLCIFLSLIFSGMESSTVNEQLTFKVVQKGKVIGEVNATKVIKNQDILYTSYTKSTTHAIIEITIISDYEVLMSDGHLQRAEANITVRGRAYAHSYTQFCEDQCEVVKDGSNVNYINEPIHYASTLLLFEEPLGVNNSYSELDGSFHEISALGDHRYQKKDPKGRTNTYFYENGKLKKAEIDAGLIKFSIVPE